MVNALNPDTGLIERDPHRSAIVDAKMRMLTPVGSRVNPNYGTLLYDFIDNPSVARLELVTQSIRTALSQSNLYTVDNITVSLVGEELSIQVTLRFPDGTVIGVPMTMVQDNRQIALIVANALEFSSEVLETDTQITVILYEGLDPDLDPTFVRREVGRIIIPKAVDGVVDNGEWQGTKLVLQRTVGDPVEIEGFPGISLIRGGAGIEVTDGADGAKVISISGSVVPTQETLTYGLATADGLAVDGSEQTRDFNGSVEVTFPATTQAGPRWYFSGVTPVKVYDVSFGEVDVTTQWVLTNGIYVGPSGVPEGTTGRYKVEV